MKHFLVPIAAVLLLCSLSWANEAASETELIVEVINRTQNGSNVEGAEVFVRIYKDRHPFDTLQGAAGSDGKVVFENVPTGENVVAMTQAKHGNMMFNGSHVALAAGQKQISATVPVFDVSSDKSHLSIKMHHIMIKAHGAELEFTEFMQLVNSSDMAVSSDERDGGDKPKVLEVKLPKGFKNFKPGEYFQADALVVSKEGFYDTMAVPPGEYSLEFSYTLDIDARKLSIAKSLPLPTSSLVIFAELGQAKVEGLGEPYNRATSASGADIEYFKLAKLGPMHKLAFEISGFNVNPSGSGTWIILAVVFGVIFVAAVVMRMRPSKS